MSEYRISRAYDPAIDGEMLRISMANARGHEFFKRVPFPGAREYKRVRDEALDAIEAAIARGDDPGEVA